MEITVAKKGVDALKNFGVRPQEAIAEGRSGSRLATECVSDASSVTTMGRLLVMTTVHMTCVMNTIIHNNPQSTPPSQLLTSINTSPFSYRKVLRDESFDWDEDLVVGGGVLQVAG